MTQRSEQDGPPNYSYESTLSDGIWEEARLPDLSAGVVLVNVRLAPFSVDDIRCCGIIEVGGDPYTAARFGDIRFPLWLPDGGPEVFQKLVIANQKAIISPTLRDKIPLRDYYDYDFLTNGRILTHQGMVIELSSVFPSQVKKEISEQVYPSFGARAKDVADRIIQVRRDLILSPITPSELSGFSLGS
jgi:hypothetical protein